MIWEYLVGGFILAWAVFYLWRLFTKKRGCTCDDCPASQQSCCTGVDSADGTCLYSADGQQKRDE